MRQRHRRKLFRQVSSPTGWPPMSKSFVFSLPDVKTLCILLTRCSKPFVFSLLELWEAAAHHRLSAWKSTSRAVKASKSTRVFSYTEIYVHTIDFCAQTPFTPALEDPIIFSRRRNLLDLQPMISALLQITEPYDKSHLV